MADNVSTGSSRLAPGFRFHPTDEELVLYYLRRKIIGKPFRFDAITEIDIYKIEPWDLPAMSRLKTRDLEWYFFSVLDRKYGNGSKTNRATKKGYWKTTGNDRMVHHKSKVVGMKKTLVFHLGRAPRGERSNWVMHEYRLVNEELEKAGSVQDAFVLCRVFQKSGPGPKNGEKYGAPFIEEEWEDDEVETFPKEEAAEEVAISDDAYLDEADLDEIFGGSIPEVAPLPSNNCGDDFEHVGHGSSVDGDGSYAVGHGSYVEEAANFVNDPPKPLFGMDEYYYRPDHDNYQEVFNVPVPNGMPIDAVRNEYIREQSHSENCENVNDMLDGQYIGASDIPRLDNDGGFLEANDLTMPIGADPSGLNLDDEYLMYFDDNADLETFGVSDSSKFMENDDLVYYQGLVVQTDMNGGNELVATPNQQISSFESDAASSSSKEQVPIKDNRASQTPLAEQISCMLGSIPAPPALASEFPMKNSAHHMNSASQSSSPIHVTAGMIEMRNMNFNGNQIDWSLGKNGNVNITLSFSLSRGFDTTNNLESMSSVPSSKTGSVMARGWLYFIFFWVLALSMSYKVGTYICAR